MVLPGFHLLATETIQYQNVTIGGEEKVDQLEEVDLFCWENGQSIILMSMTDRVQIQSATAFSQL